MKQTVQPDFTGQNIYVGMDVHKKSWTVSIFSEHHEHKTFTQPPNAQSLVGYLKRTFPGASYHAVYAAGFSGYWIHDTLHQQGVTAWSSILLTFPQPIKNVAAKMIKSTQGYKKRGFTQGGLDKELDRNV